MTAPNNDPMTRIADALELMALAHTYDVSECPAMAQIRRRIEARHSVPTVAVPVLPTTRAGNALVDELLTLKPAPAPGTAYVSGSRLRIGDVLIDGRRVVSIDAERWPVVESGSRLTPERVYFVRLPRPAAEPSAKTKCPTCRCMIAPGTECACCVSTSGDDPPLPDLDADVAEPSADEDTKRRDPGCECIQEEGDSDCPVHPSDPETGEPIGDWHRSSASGDGIARLRHELLEIGAHSWAVGELHDQPLLMASRIVSAVNDTHAHATRELREQLGADHTAAVRERDEARAEFNAIADERDRAKLERDAAIARAEAAERVVEAANVVIVAWRHKAGVITSEFGALAFALEAFRSYDAARRDGGK